MKQKVDTIASALLGIESDRQLTPEIVEEVVAEAVQRLKKRFPSASIIVHVPTDYLLIPMDAILIEQVLINLLENALIHSGSSHSPELTVTDHPDHVTFCVKDMV